MMIKSIVTIVFVATIVAGRQEQFLDDEDVVDRSLKNSLNFAKDVVSAPGSLLPGFGNKEEKLVFSGNITLEKLLEKCNDEGNQEKMVYVGATTRNAAERYNEHKREKKYFGEFYSATVEPGVVTMFHPCYFFGTTPVVSVVKLCENYLLNKCPGPKKNNKQRTSNLGHFTKEGSVYIIVGSN